MAESIDDFLNRTKGVSPKTESIGDFFKRTKGGSLEPDAAADIPTIAVKPADAPPESASQTVRKLAEVAAVPGMVASKQPLAEVLASPEALAADVPQSQAPYRGPDFSTGVRDLLAPAPNTIYGSPLDESLPMGGNPLGAMLSPFARDATTGVTRLTLPPAIRSALIGLTQEGGQATINPETNTLGVTPEAQSVAAFAANPLRFSGSTPMAFVPPGALDAKAPLSPGFMANPLSPELADRLSGNTLAAGSDGQPRSVGASGTPTPQSNMTMREQLVYRAQAEQEKLNELQPGGPDLNRYVPDVDPTMAQMEQSVKTAREQKSLSTISTEISDQARAVEKNHIEARKAYFDQIAGSKAELDALSAARSEQASADTAAAFKPGQVADATPVAATISDILNAPRAKENTALQKYVAPIMDRLYESDGTTLKSDPEQLYGLREDLERMRSKPSQAEDQNLIHVSGQLRDVRDALDQAIEGGAPGYRTYMDNYANASRRINELETLQGHENGLNGFKTFTPFQGMMRKIVEARQAPGNNPYKSISDDTMSQLWALRNDLRRAASAEDLAKARGSDTLQNALDVAKTVTKTGIRAAMHYGLYHATGDLGANAILGMADMFNSQRLQAKTVRRAHEMLNPNPLHYPPPNAGP